MLHVRRFGSGDRLVALHGFSLTGSQFAGITPRLAYSIDAPDLPGHGASASSPTDVASVTDALTAVIEDGETPTHLLGYSQGARLALLIARSHPDLVRALVLISGTAGIRDEQDRRNRATQDDARAARLELLGLDRFLEEWTSRGITSTAHLDEAARAADMEIRRENSAEGLAAALRGYGQGVQPVVWDDLGDIDVPTLLIAGARDERYVDLARDMDEALPTSEIVVIPDAGHNPLADRPNETLEAVSGFLDRHG